jgi:hypothetical protein
LASTARAAVAAPAQPRRQPSKAAPKTARRKATTGARARRRAHSRAAIAWIVVFGALLAGVVFVNLLVLQLNLRLDSATQERTKLKADNAALVAQLSAALASPRIQKLAAKQDGLVQADPSSIRYIDLSK